MMMKSKQTSLETKKTNQIPQMKKKIKKKVSILTLKTKKSQKLMIPIDQLH